MKLKEVAKVVRGGYAETLAYCEMPREHWRRIRTNNAIERLNREIRRRCIRYDKTRRIAEQDFDTSLANMPTTPIGYLGHRHRRSTKEARKE